MQNNKKYTIYKHTNIVNNKIYIGQTCQKPEYRWNHGEGYKNSPHFYAAICKYGWDLFSHEILETNLTQDQANRKEIEYIQYYQSNNPKYGYNSESGGNNKIPNEETKKLQSQSALNRPIVTESTKNKLSQINKGHHKTNETKEKMSIAAQKREANKKFKKERPVRCINTNEIFLSLRAAADWCGLAGTSGIASVCQKKKQITAGVHPITKEKLKWEYI